MCATCYEQICQVILDKNLAYTLKNNNGGKSILKIEWTYKLKPSSAVKQQQVAIIFFYFTSNELLQIWCLIAFKNRAHIYPLGSPRIIFNRSAILARYRRAQSIKRHGASTVCSLGVAAKTTSDIRYFAINRSNDFPPFVCLITILLIFFKRSFITH